MLLCKHLACVSLLSNCMHIQKQYYPTASLSNYMLILLQVYPLHAYAIVSLSNYNLVQINYVMTSPICCIYNRPNLLDVPITFSNSILSSTEDRSMWEVTIMDFPRAIMVEILSRMPIKPIFRCKTVRKTWYQLLTSDPLFRNM